MVYRLEISKQVAKFLDKSEANLKVKIITTFELLAQEPFPLSLMLNLWLIKKGILDFA